MFIDEAHIMVKAGAGGAGCVSMRREKHVPKGGPDGGDGGKGGDVLLVGDQGQRTLQYFRYHRHFHAKKARHGEGANRHGANGADMVLVVPLGTIAYDEHHQVIGEILEHDQKLVVAKGGRGGRGNAAFASSVRKVPTFAEKGEPTDEVSVFLELRLLADVGIVGYPNVGKSTLISRISKARPKIADYPFTTTVPNLGVATDKTGRSFVVADIPGLIRGAHLGKGLGHAFLRHIRRTSVLVHMVDLSEAGGGDPIGNYEDIREELTAYDPELAERPEIVLGAKLDLPGAPERSQEAADYFSARGVVYMPVSAVTGEGIETLVFKLAETVEQYAPVVEGADETVAKVYKYDDERQVQVARDVSGNWRLSCRALERQVAMTDFDNEEAVAYLQRRMRSFHTDEALRSAGAQEGETVVIGSMEFEFKPE